MSPDLDQQSNLSESPPAPEARRFSANRILSGMMIRKKLIVLHTAFSLSLGAILLIAIMPAMSKVIHGAEVEESQLVLDSLLNTENGKQTPPSWQQDAVRVVYGSESTIGIPDQLIYQARLTPDQAQAVSSDGHASGVICWISEQDSFVIVRVRAQRARDAIQLVYLLVIATLLVGYALVAAALELFVLPQHVYRPISAMLAADQAVSEGNREHELIDESLIPADELGSIMRSRNEAIDALRTNEGELAYALDRLEHTAADLHKKNHLLETARKNLEGADRLASLGMMSAGIAHELNTPLAVVKGLVEKLHRDGDLNKTEIALLARVVGRLETLSEGLLDFARVRPPMNEPADIAQLVNEASTLVSIDRKDAIELRGIRVDEQVPAGHRVFGDPDRLVQVFVNLIRNAVDALAESQTPDPQVRVELHAERRDDAPWVVIRVIDNGPGIDSELIDRLFEPFVSTRLDSQGTGLGLAVANGIVREHGGLLTATNQSSQGPQRGAAFEVLLPVNASSERLVSSEC